MSFKDRKVDIPETPLDADDPFGHNPHVHPGGPGLPPTAGVDDPDAVPEELPDAESGPAERPAD